MAAWSDGARTMIGKRHTLALLGIAVALALAPVASAGGWTESWESIRGAARDVRSIKTDFVQTRTVKILKSPIVSRGRLVYRRPDDLRWEYTGPIKSVLLVRKGSVERYIGRDGGFVRDSSAKLDSMSTVIREINLWLAGDFSASKTFRPALVQAEGSTKVELVPIDPSMRSIISRIVLTPGSKAGTVESISIDEGAEGTTRIDFTGVRINDGVTDADFAPPR
jgi:outer membrane lipoprotein-sorting protein